MYLEQINQAGDIKKLKGEELAALAQEIREFLIEKIQQYGRSSGIQSGCCGADHGSPPDF